MYLSVHKYILIGKPMYIQNVSVSVSISVSKFVMAALSSPAFFSERALAIGFSQPEVDLLKANGWTSMGRFAFATPQAPGMGDDHQLVQEVVTPIFGDRPGALVALTRRLYFEAYTYAASDMKLRVERGDDEPPRKMPRVEREDRVDAIRGRLGVTTISDERVPGSSVVDFYNACAEEGTLRYLPWSKIVSTKIEASGKPVAEWKPDRTGFIRVMMTDEIPSQEIGHNLLKLEHVMVRRAVAMEAAKLLSFESAMRASAMWFEHMEDAPADPDLYDSTSLEQVQKADVELFNMVARKCKKGLMLTPTGEYPIEVHWLAALAGTRIAQILVPLAKPVRRSVPNVPQQSAANKMQHQERAQQNHQQKQPKGGKKGKKQGGKAKGTGKGTPRPAELMDCVTSTAGGDPICFAFNLDGCSSGIAAGARCPKGWHMCAKPGCGKNHSQRNHE